MTTCVQPIIFIFLTSMSCTTALRNYNIIFSDVKCTTNENYMQNVNCTIAKSAPGLPQINIGGQMKKEIKELRGDFYINLMRQNRQSIQFVKITNVDGCTKMNENITSPVQKMLRDVISKYGNSPRRCPIRAGFMYVYRGITLDPKYLPEFVPEADFEAAVVLYDKKFEYWRIVTYGRISNVRKSKRRGRF